MFRDNPAATDRSDSLIPGNIGHDRKTRPSNPEGRSTSGFWHPAGRKWTLGCSSGKRKEMPSRCKNCIGSVPNTGHARMGHRVTNFLSFNHLSP
jgi:hypothetical protein